jgi:hypothetical protein
VRQLRPSAVAAGVAGMVILASLVYLPMLSTGVGIGDEAEAQTVPYILGIAHPTGFPAYTMAGWLFSHALAVSSVAWRLNAFTAVLTAMSTAGVLLLALELGSGIAASVCGAAAFGFGTAVWVGALHANAQALAATLSIYALVACVAFACSGSTRALLVACVCCGLGIATHPSAIWILPAVAVAVAWQRGTMTLARTLAATLALGVPLLLYAYFPMRMAVVAATGADPTAAAPLFGEGSMDWNMAAGRTSAGFLDEVLARNEHATSALGRTFDPHALGAIIATWFGFAALQYPIGVMLLAAAGAAGLARSNVRAASVIFAGTAGGIAFAYVYRGDVHVGRYLVVSFAVTAALAAASARVVLPAMSARTVRIVATLALAALAVTAAIGNRGIAASTTHVDGSSIIASIARDTPPGSIIVASWDQAAALGYGAYAEHALGSRLIVSGWPSQYLNRYADWIRLRHLIVVIPGREPIDTSPPDLQYRPLRPADRRFRYYEVEAAHGNRRR